MCPLLGTWLATQACALTGNRTSDPLVHRPALNSLSHTSQGPSADSLGDASKWSHDESVLLFTTKWYSTARTDEHSFSQPPAVRHWVMTSKPLPTWTRGPLWAQEFHFGETKAQEGSCRVRCYLRASWRRVFALSSMGRQKDLDLA